MSEIKIETRGRLAYFAPMPMQSHGDVALSISQENELHLEYEGYYEWKSSYLSREMVAAMLPHLTQFAETGEIGEPDHERNV